MTHSWEVDTKRLAPIGLASLASLALTAPWAATAADVAPVIVNHDYREAPVDDIDRRVHKNIATVARANKLARGTMKLPVVLDRHSAAQGRQRPTAGDFEADRSVNPGQEPNAKAELKALKNALDKTPFGPKLVAARKHFLGAVMAFATKDDARCRRELDAAVRSYFL